MPLLTLLAPDLPFMDIYLLPEYFVGEIKKIKRTNAQYFCSGRIGHSAIDNPTEINILQASPGYNGSVSTSVIAS